MVPTQRAIAIASPLQDVLSKVRVVLATQAFDPAVSPHGARRFDCRPRLGHPPVKREGVRVHAAIW
jgi:hypothetical protein